MKVESRKIRWVRAVFGCLAFFGHVYPLAAQIQGLPASDQLGQEDIWQNPTFVGGVANGGPTAHSEW